MKPMKKRYEWTIIASLGGLITFIAVSPMITFPTSKHAHSSLCGGELGQIKELERYGDVEIKYAGYVPYYERDKGNWYVSFSSSYKQAVHISASERSHTLCEGVDTLYYKVMEHPMKPTDD